MVESHLDFIKNSRRRAPDFVALPPTGDFSGHVLLDLDGARRRQGKLIDLFQQLGDALSLPENRSARYFCRMRGEHWDDANLPQGLQSDVQRDPGVSNP